MLLLLSATPNSRTQTMDTAVDETRAKDLADSVVGWFDYVIAEPETDAIARDIVCFDTALFIRAKRVSNCYMREKKN